jgi:23S rRNA (adenine2030-N6)-methyltransferase
VRGPATPAQLYGTGMIIVNPPFVLEEELRVLLPALAKVLADGAGGHRIEWLRGE